jgi:hypothetical protein
LSELSGGAMAGSAVAGWVDGIKVRSPAPMGGAAGLPFAACAPADGALPDKACPCAMVLAPIARATITTVDAIRITLTLNMCRCRFNPTNCLGLRTKPTSG